MCGQVFHFFPQIKFSVVDEVLLSRRLISFSEDVVRSLLSKRSSRTLLFRQTASLRKGNKKGFKPKALRKANTVFKTSRSCYKEGKNPPNNELIRGKSEEGNTVNENTEKTHPFLAVAKTETVTADCLPKNVSTRGKQHLSTVCHSPKQIPETMQETWQKASEYSLPSLLLMLTTTAVLPGQLRTA